jgi:hypothetical protein
LKYNNAFQEKKHEIVENFHKKAQLETEIIKLQERLDIQNQKIDELMKENRTLANNLEKSNLLIAEYEKEESEDEDEENGENEKSFEEMLKIRLDAVDILGSESYFYLGHEVIDKGNFHGIEKELLKLKEIFFHYELRTSTYSEVILKLENFISHQKQKKLEQRLMEEKLQKEENASIFELKK